MRRLMIAIATAGLLASQAIAANLQRGYAAFAAGDYETALAEFSALAEQGDAQAQVSLGVMYATGRGVLQDHTEAERWFRLAAEQGDAGAQSALADMYSEGEGVSQDHAEAARWFRLAAEQGDAFAQNRLGVMYAEGEGMPANYISAHIWFNIAAANGDQDARENRSRLESGMRREDITEAQGRAQVCMNSNYRDCD
jgi:TPR repeat protein